MAISGGYDFNTITAISIVTASTLSQPSRQLLHNPT